MRKQYESKFDLSNEQDVSNAISKAWGASLHKLPISYRLDFLLTKDNAAKAVVEVKSRRNAHNKYPTLMLSLSKWNHGVEYTIINKLKFLLIAKFTDGIFYYNYSNKDDFDIKWGGRTVQTRDSADIEPIIHIPVNKLKRL